MSEDTWLQNSPRLRPELLISGPLMRGPRRVHLIKDVEADASFAVGEKEYFLISRLDGQTPLAEVGDAYAGRFGRRVDAQSWHQVLDGLQRRGLLIGAPPCAAGPSADRPRSSLLRGEVAFFRDASSAIEGLYGRTRWLQAHWVMGALLVAVSAMLWVLAVSLADLLPATGEAFTRWPLVVAVVFTLWVSAGLHELAHGIAARHRGGTVTGVGLLWRLPMVILYCRVGDYLFLVRRRDRIATAAAGTVANLVFLLPLFFAWLLVGGTYTALDLYLAAVLVLGTALGLANLVPIPPLDGYAMLSHALGMINLSAESRRFVTVATQSVLGRGDGVASYPRWARVAYVGYAAGSTLLVVALAVAAVVISAELLPESLGAWRFAAPIAAVMVIVAGLSVRQRTRGVDA